MVIIIRGTCGNACWPFPCFEAVNCSRAMEIIPFRAVEFYSVSDIIVKLYLGYRSPNNCSGIVTSCLAWIFSAKYVLKLKIGEKINNICTKLTFYGARFRPFSIVLAGHDWLTLLHKTWVTLKCCEITSLKRWAPRHVSIFRFTRGRTFNLYFVKNNQPMIYVEKNFTLYALILVTSKKLPLHSGMEVDHSPFAWQVASEAPSIMYPWWHPNVAFPPTWVPKRLIFGGAVSFRLRVPFFVTEV